ncbi:MAG: cystathionine beta-lyase [Proteobacteria bacterium]|nr:cystathionine beta-lyase [Pseudomonadota bacterium]
MKPDTHIVHTGRHPERQHGFVNPGVYHGSTVLFPSLADMKAAQSDPYRAHFYGRLGTPTSRALEEAIADLEGAPHCVATASGLAAIIAGVIGFLKTGDHMLVVDSVYGPARRFFNDTLRRFGVDVQYYDPMTGADIADLLRANTKVVYCESPGSGSFEVQDLPAIASAAHAIGAKVVIDNTWASPVLFKPFAHGADVSIQAATKYIVGHSDAMMGSISMTEEVFPIVRAAARDLGAPPGPDDCYLALRGIRTLGLRLTRHQETGLKLANWFASRPEVHRVLHPGLAACPGHAIWKRDFLGASGLFGVVFKDASEAAVAAMIDGYELFGIGFSWGGFESLVLPTHPEAGREVTGWTMPGPTIRYHAGLEDPDDLIADLEKGMARLTKTG